MATLLKKRGRKALEPTVNTMVVSCSYKKFIRSTISMLNNV
jgi:predicted HAD superfamily phosphohydrolase